ncbi:acyl-CoA Delta-9 desaturase-like isoform X1 [Neocloeon triangulifer]|uniref:acyl-CoA Delta-9 desaturase-like isoform X1 n=1 Tax=Neocloeon triangulifer TaxID=2078957 RepID=UPI00286F11A0|nr:acyl-CoA Delta-9 desaturase-like isoform X1 [Neocloeon triangulifer]
MVIIEGRVLVDPLAIGRSAMAPNLPSPTAKEYLPAAAPMDSALPEAAKVEANPQKETYKVHLVWRNIIAFIYLHLGALYGLYLCVSLNARFYTFLWAFLVAAMGAMGITAGAHRLWSHRAYKAKWPLRLMLAAFQTMAFQNHIYEWVRDHRVHHKFSETDADPHNASRGFFFSHVGWLLCRKHPDVRRKGATVDMSDMDADPIVVWQRRTYLVLMPLLCFVLPVWVPCYFWSEKGWYSWYVAGVMRYVLSLNGTWLVNSAAHIWGVKPYDKNISPTENRAVAIAAFGEGWHNYHHVFPWDYKAAELGNYKLNLTTAFIDFFAKIGWAYDLKAVPVALVKKRAERTGDGSWVNHHHKEGETALWGWGDKDMSAEERTEIEQYKEKSY